MAMTPKSPYPLPPSHLHDAISSMIAERANQRITFAEYMDLVLYHPQYGYYVSQALNMGPQGDFLTSPHLSADFGEMLAVQFLQMWEILGQPTPFTLVEMGAGQGLLAADILQYLQHYPDFFRCLKYLIVERSGALRKEQQHRLQNYWLSSAKESCLEAGVLRWVTLEEIPTASIIGCCFSNELVDALPVHQFVVENGQLWEVYVTSLADRGFGEVIDKPSTPRLTQYFDLVNVQLASRAYPSGYRSEVNLAALDWLSLVADRLQRGYLLTIDYGYPASRYYNPQRQQGTLQCYYCHRHHNNPYVNIGQQDITAHVDFTSLERWGERCGLKNLGFTQQGLFLMALGLGDRILSLAHNTQAMVEAQGLASLLKRRDALHQLINPQGLGRFGVLVQSKGLKDVETTHPLKGFPSHQNQSFA